MARVLPDQPQLLLIHRAEQHLGPFVGIVRLSEECIVAVFERFAETYLKGEDSLAQSHGLDEPGRQPVPVEIVGNSRSTVEIACLQHRKINIVWRCAEVHHHAAWIENATRFRKDVDLRAARYQDRKSVV